MSTLNQLRAKSTDLSDHLRKRPRRDTTARQVATLVRQRRRERRLRAGGLKAEQVADERLAAEARGKVWALILGRTGRRIDLVSLLRQRREDGQPRWAIADPTVEPSWSNGGYDEDGDVKLRGTDYDNHCITVQSKCRNVDPGKGFPALPPRVRELATDPKVRKRAEFVGVLYQPEEWREVDPDPALVVKWRGIEGYFALAVWGGDRAELMEFVD